MVTLVTSALYDNNALDGAMKASLECSVSATIHSMPPYQQGSVGSSVTSHTTQHNWVYNGSKFNKSKLFQHNTNNSSKIPFISKYVLKIHNVIT